MDLSSNVGLTFCPLLCTVRFILISAVSMQLLQAWDKAETAMRKKNSFFTNEKFCSKIQSYNEYQYKYCSIA